MNNILSRLLIPGVTILLCACVGKIPLIQSADTAPSASSAEQANPFRGQLVVKPRETIEKNQMQVSYNIKSIPSDANALMLILTFRNLKASDAKLNPKIILSDGKGKALEAYSMEGFFNYAKQTTRSASAKGAASDQVNLARSEEMIKWANSFWLKDRFTIPANGIEVGGLIFRCKTICQPKQLSVTLGKQEYAFTIN